MVALRVVMSRAIRDGSSASVAARAQAAITRRTCDPLEFHRCRRDRAQRDLFARKQPSYDRRLLRPPIRCRKKPRQPQVRV